MRYWRFVRILDGEYIAFYCVTMEAMTMTTTAKKIAKKILRHNLARIRSACLIAPAGWLPQACRDAGIDPHAIMTVTTEETDRVCAALAALGPRVKIDVSKDHYGDGADYVADRGDFAQDGPHSDGFEIDRRRVTR